MLRDWLQEVGIVVNSEATELGTLNNILKTTHEYDLGIYYSDFDIDPLNMDFSYTCWSAESGVGNRSGYCDPRVDELITKYVTTADREEGLGYLYQAQAIAHDRRPLIPLVVRNGITGYNNSEFAFADEICPSGAASAGVWGSPYIMDAVPQ